MKVRLPSGGSVTAVVRGSGPDSFLFAHGAGTTQHHRSIVGTAEALAQRGVRVVTFNYPYSEAGRRAPDRPRVLLDCHRAVASTVGGRLFLGGRSMGGRMATMLAADGFPSLGIVLYAYPLHPAGKPETLRVAHLPDVDVPMLFFQGSRDALSRSDLFDTHIRPLRGASVVDMEGADHSFRGTQWPEPAIFEFLADRTVEWMRTVG